MSIVHLSKDTHTLERKLEPKSAAQNGGEKIAMDEARFRYLLNDDAMATEKLAEGIRAFAKDLGTLKAMVAKKLDA